MLCSLCGTSVTRYMLCLKLDRERLQIQCTFRSSARCSFRATIREIYKGATLCCDHWFQPKRKRPVSRYHPWPKADVHPTAIFYIDIRVHRVCCRPLGTSASGSHQRLTDCASQTRHGGAHAHRPVAHLIVKHSSLGVMLCSAHSTSFSPPSCSSHSSTTTAVRLGSLRR